MDRKNNHLAKVFSEVFPIQEPILEIGSYQVDGQEGIINLRPYFSGKKFIGTDMRQGPGVDQVENVERLSFEDGSIGTVIILNTLEHVEDPIRAMDEINRVLKNDGLVLMSSVMDFNIHDFPSDYWRFTPESFRYMLRNFKTKFVAFDGDALKPRMVFAVGIKDTKPKYDDLLNRFKEAYKAKNSGVGFWFFNVLLALRSLFRAVIGKTMEISIKYESEK